MYGSSTPCTCCYSLFYTGYSTVRLHTAQFRNIRICSIPIHRNLCKFCFRLLIFFLCQCNRGCSKVLLHALCFPHPRNRHNEISCSKSKSGWLRSTFSGLNLVITCRTSSPVYVCSFVYFPLKKPLASGENGTKPIPSSSQAGITSFQTSFPSWKIHSVPL